MLNLTNGVEMSVGAEDASDAVVQHDDEKEG